MVKVMVLHGQVQLVTNEEYFKIWSQKVNQCDIFHDDAIALNIFQGFEVCPKYL